MSTRQEAERELPIRGGGYVVDIGPDEAAIVTPGAWNRWQGSNDLKRDSACRKAKAEAGGGVPIIHGMCL